MKKCQNPDHPHCTQWVQPGASVCDAQHAQPSDGTVLNALQLSQPELPNLYQPSSKPRNPNKHASNGIAPHLANEVKARAELLAAAQTSLKPNGLHKLEPTASLPLSQPAINNGYKTQAVRPHLHVSGFDPRAAGGRQSIKLGLQGIIAPPGAEIVLHARSELLAGKELQSRAIRTGSGEWRPILLPFSSRGKEHGQYSIEIELLLSNDRLRRKWICTLVLLVPREDASLSEIHQTFLATHKNVRVQAEDGSIANLQGLLAGSGGLSLDIQAKNGALAQVALEGEHGHTRGKHDVGFASIAWDEDLLEVEHNELSTAATPTLPDTPQTACILTNGLGLVQHLRLFAMQECVMGRWQTDSKAEAQILLAQFSSAGGKYVPGEPLLNGLTRRISARHALLHFGAQGVMIEDISRFGLLLDGEWPGRNKPTLLRRGMQIHFSHSFRDIVQLEVLALLPHLLLLQRNDGGRLAECFYLLKPNTRPTLPLPPSAAMPSGFPLLFHYQHAFWHLDRVSGQQTRLQAESKWPPLADLAPSSHLREAVYSAEELPGDTPSALAALDQRTEG